MCHVLPVLLCTTRKTSCAFQFHRGPSFPRSSPHPIKDRASLNAAQLERARVYQAQATSSPPCVLTQPTLAPIPKPKPGSRPIHLGSPSRTARMPRKVRARALHVAREHDAHAYGKRANDGHSSAVPLQTCHAHTHAKLTTAAKLEPRASANGYNHLRNAV